MTSKIKSITKILNRKPRELRRSFRTSIFIYTVSELTRSLKKQIFFSKIKPYFKKERSSKTQLKLYNRKSLLSHRKEWVEFEKDLIGAS